MSELYKKYYQLCSRLKGLPGDISFRLGRKEPFLKQAAGSRILVYHGICKKDPLRYNTLFVTLRTFEAQLKLYKKYFNIVSLDDYYQRRFSDDKFTICLSFDDGLANNYHYILPLLDQYQVPATFFVTAITATGYNILWNDYLSIAYQYGPSGFRIQDEYFSRSRDGKYIAGRTGAGLADTLRKTGFENKQMMLDGGDSFLLQAQEDFWLQMNHEQIRKLSASKWVTIGSHGYYHNDLAMLPVATAQQEIKDSKEFLESITGKEITALAFPYGSYTPETIAGAKKAGYTQLLGTAFLFAADKEDATMRERFTINPFISSINQVYANINGHYS